MPDYQTTVEKLRKASMQHGNGGADRETSESAWILLRAQDAELARLRAENARIIGKIRALKEAHDIDHVQNEFEAVLQEASR